MFGVDVGTAVGGYRIRSEIGRGATSVVFAAEAPGGGLVALKLGAQVRRFVPPQQHVDHPAIARVHAVVEDARWGRVLVMDLVDGKPLSALIDQGRLPVALALLVLEQLAAALDHAHAAWLIHGDVRPGNVLVHRPTGRAWLTDFGVARRPSVHYTAPEVVAGAVRSSAADRYSLAALAFTALVGSPMFPRPTDDAVLAAHATEPPPAPSRRRAVLPEALDPVLAAGLAKQPSERPDTATALAAAITEALRGHAAFIGSPPRRSWRRGRPRR